MHEGIFELQSFEVCFIVSISLKIQICFYEWKKSLPSVQAEAVL